MIANLDMNFIIKMIREVDTASKDIDKKCLLIFEDLEKKWSENLTEEKKLEFSNDAYKTVNDFYEIGYGEGFKQGVEFIKTILNK